jgi:nucleoid-associated protein YgaU
MNRQVGPSIVLSVLIVCFFAVALYQRDPPRPSQGRGRTGIGEQNRRSGPLIRSSTVQAGSTVSAQPATALSEGPARAIALVSDSSITAFGPEPADSGRSGVAGSVRSEGSNTGQRIDGGRRPASAFTTVVANETLQDVARRVYGSGHLADSLWRANRDALSRRESPLAAGMVLRTPAVR